MKRPDEIDPQRQSSDVERSETKEPFSDPRPHEFMIIEITVRNARGEVLKRWRP